jgi:antitoxin (DNA-binding transcriptional repressor) of toxin-antitoxin stability system
MVRVSDDGALVYTMRDFGQQTARVMGEIEDSGQPAFITRHGRFIAVITPLAPERVESRVPRRWRARPGNKTMPSPEAPGRQHILLSTPALPARP